MKIDFIICEEKIELQNIYRKKNGKTFLKNVHFHVLFIIKLYLIVVELILLIKLLEYTCMNIFLVNDYLGV